MRRYDTMQDKRRHQTGAMTQLDTKTCEECGSMFLSKKSRMDSLCPECAHLLYGYEPCRHTFVSGRCSSCHWDGSVSEYCRTIQKKDRTVEGAEDVEIDDSDGGDISLRRV